MTNSVRGGLLVSLILVALVFYYFIWVYQPPDATPSADADNGSTVAGPVNYLEATPEIPNRSTMEVGDPAPDFMYYTIDGEQVRLSDYAGQKHVVLDFWGTYCGPCRQEMPLLNNFYAEHSDEVEIIAITSESKNNARAVRNFVENNNLDFKVMHDPSGSIISLYPTRGIPYLVFIDKNGVAVDKHLGFDPGITNIIGFTFGLD